MLFVLEWLMARHHTVMTCLAFFGPYLVNRTSRRAGSTFLVSSRVR
jgi:hypothetical protein